MKLLRTTLPASVLLGGCLAAPPNDTIAEAEEDAAEATDALAAAPPDDLPRWRVYQAGRDATATRHDPDPVLDPNNIAMTPRDRETLCKVALAASTFGACGAAALACVGAEVITLGSVTVPCVWLGLVLCGAHGSAAGVVDCEVVAN